MEKKIDLIIVSEQYKNIKSPNWFSDISCTAAIWINNPSKFRVRTHGCGNGYVWVRGDMVTVISCYLTPNEPIKNFESKIIELEDVVRCMDGNVIVAGDFNAKSPGMGNGL